MGSGEAEKIVTAPKNNIQEGKPRVTLLPLDVLETYLVPVFEEGLVKYYRESWRGGFEISVMMDACMRHLIAFYYKGEDYDPSTPPPIKKHHLGAALFCITSMLHTLETRPELDDRFSKK